MTFGWISSDAYACFIFTKHCIRERERGNIRARTTKVDLGIITRPLADKIQDFPRVDLLLTRRHSGRLQVSSTAPNYWSNK